MSAGGPSMGSLSHHIITAIMCRASITDKSRKVLFALSTELNRAKERLTAETTVYYDGATTVVLHCNRIFSSGDNSSGQCGLGTSSRRVSMPRHVRLPPTQRIWVRNGGWFAMTTRGLYGWGLCKGKLGVGTGRLKVPSPTRVRLTGRVLEIVLFNDETFIRTPVGWHGCGRNADCQLGLGHATKSVDIPTPIPNTDTVTRWVHAGAIFAISSDGGLRSCGHNFGQCGPSVKSFRVTTLTPVAIPDEAARDVAKIIAAHQALFIICGGGRCFSTGNNAIGQLGIGVVGSTIQPIAELPLRVLDVALCAGTTLLMTADGLHGCGSNQHHEIAATDTYSVLEPTPIPLPPSVDVAVAAPSVLFVRSAGEWVGRGQFSEAWFISTPGVEPGDGVTTWTMASVKHSKVLDALAARGGEGVLTIHKDKEE